ncbi:COG3650 family protein [Aurantiacibacter marinus]|uniref:Lipoprotein n=1 Tax=Aurantiacibacter marinus TaxID=874156 RepID=A0A0H0XKB8_9SPHN|nr:hypothetical protein [Aurantiacibacter marinus]KLI63053.1 hypothetical protein AAV99_13000 [Aurantiacibacter marinus]
MNRFYVAAVSSLLLTACQQGGGEGLPGNSDDDQPYSGIAEDAVLELTGTEPFWNATINGLSMVWRTPENIDGVNVSVERFAGRGGLSFSGQLEGTALDIAVTPGECSDGMSDRTYPFTATVVIGRDQRNGCAWRAGVDEAALGEP